MTILNDNLQFHYAEFLEQETPWLFFDGLADYVQFILETPDLKVIADTLIRERDDIYGKLEEYDDKAFNELRLVAKKILEIVRKMRIRLENTTYLKDVRNPKKGQCWPISKQYDSDSDKLDWCLREITEGLKAKYPTALKDFVDYSREWSISPTDSPVGICNPCIEFSPKLKEKRSLHDHIIGLRDSSVWGAFDAMHIVYEAREASSKHSFESGYDARLFDKLDMAGYLKYLKRDSSGNKSILESERATAIALKVSEFDKIRPKEYNSWRSVGPNELSFLKIYEFKEFASKVHKHFLKEIARLPGASSKIDISIHKKEGIFRKKEGQTPRYPMRGVKNWTIIDALLEAGEDGISISDLRSKARYTTDSDVYKAISKMNKLFKKNLELEENLIVHHPTGGYTLNYRKFNIVS